MQFSPSFGRGAGFAGGAGLVFLCQCINRINYDLWKFKHIYVNLRNHTFILIKSYKYQLCFSYVLVMVAIGSNIAVGLVGYGLDWF